MSCSRLKRCCIRKRKSGYVRVECDHDELYGEALDLEVWKQRAL
jgi:hypothetical protein